MRRASSLRYFSPASLKVWPSPDVFHGDLLARKSHPDKVVMPHNSEQPKTFNRQLSIHRLAALHSGGTRPKQACSLCLALGRLQKKWGCRVDLKDTESLVDVRLVSVQCHCCIVVAQELKAAVQGSSFVWTEVEPGVRGLQDIRRVPSAFQGRGIRDEGPMFVTYF